VAGHLGARAAATAAVLPAARVALRHRDGQPCGRSLPAHGKGTQVATTSTGRPQHRMKEGIQRKLDCLWRRTPPLSSSVPTQQKRNAKNKRTRGFAPGSPYEAHRGRSRSPHLPARQWSRSPIKTIRTRTRPPELVPARHRDKTKQHASSERNANRGPRY